MVFVCPNLKALLGIVYKCATICQLLALFQFNGFNDFISVATLAGPNNHISKRATAWALRFCGCVHHGGGQGGGAALRQRMQSDKVPYLWAPHSPSPSERPGRTALRHNQTPVKSETQGGLLPARPLSAPTAGSSWIQVLVTPRFTSLSSGNFLANIGRVTTCICGRRALRRQTQCGGSLVHCYFAREK